jgi:hypothetical protein
VLTRAREAAALANANAAAEKEKANNNAHSHRQAKRQKRQAETDDLITVAPPSMKPDTDAHMNEDQAVIPAPLVHATHADDSTMRD